MIGCSERESTKSATSRKAGRLSRIAYKNTKICTKSHPPREEFIHDGEIVETLAYARENRANRPRSRRSCKSGRRQGVTHREAAVLLECELEDLNQRMFTLAKQIG